MKGNGDEIRVSYWFALKDELLAYHCSCKWKLCQKGVASIGSQIRYIFFIALCVCAWLQKVTAERAGKQIKQNKSVPHLSVRIHYIFNRHESVTPADPQPEPCTAHTSGHSSISSTHQPRSDCWQVLNLVLALSTCPGKLPVWPSEVTQVCKTLTPSSEIMDRLFWELQEERSQGEQILHHPQGQHQGGFPALPLWPAAHCSACHCSHCHKWSHTLWWCWIWLRTHCALTNDPKLSWLWCWGAFLWLREKAQLMWSAGSPISKRKEVSNPELQDNGLQSSGVYAWKTCHWCRTETCLSWPFTWCNLTGPIAHLKGRRWKCIWLHWIYLLIYF